MDFTMCETEKQRYQASVNRFKELLPLTQKANALKMTFPLIGILIKTKQMHADIRKIFNSCEAECAETPCFGFLGKIAEEIRDFYADLYDTIDRYPVLSFLFKRSIYNTLMDWDDLAEDIEIGSDKEFRRLIFSIAARLRSNSVTENI